MLILESFPGRQNTTETPPEDWDAGGSHLGELFLPEWYCHWQISHCWWDVNWCRTTEDRWSFLNKLQTKLTYDPAISLLDIYSKKIKILIRKDTYTLMFIAALFIIAKMQKQPHCSLTDEWIKMLYLYSVEYYSAIKRTKSCHLLQHRWSKGYHIKWNNLDERQMLYDLTYMWNVKTKPSKKTRWKQTYRFRDLTGVYQRGVWWGFRWNR